MNDLLKTISADEFEVPVRMFEWKGRPAMLAKDASMTLWHTSDSSPLAVKSSERMLLNNIRDEWSEDFIEGVDFEIVQGDELAPFKEAGLIGSRAPSAMVLTESGLQLAAMLARTEPGRRFRRWLVDVVLPQHKQTMARLLGDTQARVLQLEDNEKRVKRKEEKTEEWVQATWKGQEQMEAAYKSQMEGLRQEMGFMESQLNGMKSGLMKKPVKRKTW